MLEESPALYIARRDAYAAFLTAADAESHVAWFRKDGRYEDEGQAVAAVDRAYAETRAAFNAIDVEDTGPVREARTLLERLAALHHGGGVQPDWKDVKTAREAFVGAARASLRGMRGGC